MCVRMCLCLAFVLNAREMANEKNKIKRRTKKHTKRRKERTTENEHPNRICVFVAFDNFGNLISIIVFKEQHMPTKRWIAKIDREKKPNEMCGERRLLKCDWANSESEYTQRDTQIHTKYGFMKIAEHSQNQMKIKWQHRQNIEHCTIDEWIKQRQTV